MLGTSDAWSTIHLSQQISEPAYHILDWRILVLVEPSRWNSKKENDDKGSWSSSICRHELAIKGKWSSEASYSEWLFYCPDITLGPFDWARAVHCAVFEALKNYLNLNSLVFLIFANMGSSGSQFSCPLGINRSFSKWQIFIWSRGASYSEWLFYCPNITLGPFDRARAVYYFVVFEALKTNLNLNCFRLSE